MPNQTGIVVVKNEHILNNLSLLGGEINRILEIIDDPHMKRHMVEYTKEEIQPYPPPRQGSSYIRTYELFRGWETTANKRDLSTRSFNPVQYADYVVGEEQNPMHEPTGWRKIKSHEQPLLASATPVAAKHAEDEIAMFLFRRVR